MSTRTPKLQGKEKIRDRDGRVVASSRNLAGIRRWARTHTAKVVAIAQVNDYEGRMCILFSDGSSYETRFASYSVLYHWVQNWRAVYGAKLYINTTYSGTVPHGRP